SKDDLLQAGWKDVAVGDNSLEQAISSLRRFLGAHPSGVAYIETVPRRGYRFGVAVTRMASRESDAALDALLAPHRAFIEGRAAAKRAVALEPDNWRHHFRLAYVSWGEERLRAAHQTLALLPDFPMAHWLAATVHVARQVLNEAARELAAGVAAEAGRPTGASRFSAVALHWVLGLIHLAEGDAAGAPREVGGGAVVGTAGPP